MSLLWNGHLWCSLFWIKEWLMPRKQGPIKSTRYHHPHLSVWVYLLLEVHTTPRETWNNSLIKRLQIFVKNLDDEIRRQWLDNSFSVEGDIEILVHDLKTVVADFDTASLLVRVAYLSKKGNMSFVILCQKKQWANSFKSCITWCRSRNTVP